MGSGKKSHGFKSIKFGDLCCSCLSLEVYLSTFRDVPPLYLLKCGEQLVHSFRGALGVENLYHSLICLRLFQLILLFIRPYVWACLI